MNEFVGPVKIPDRPNVTYLTIWRDSDMRMYATGGFSGAYVLPYMASRNSVAS